MAVTIPISLGERKFLTIRQIKTRSAMITSKLTSKAQTTVPQPVRTALGLREGDEIAHVIEAGRVVMSRPVPEPVDDPLVSFSEWASDADCRAYGKL
jgi:antitoxin PrlF